MAKRKILAELIEGVEAMKKHREGKLTLRSYTVEVGQGRPRPYKRKNAGRDACATRGG